MSTRPTEPWGRKDGWWGLVFLLTGALVTSYVFLGLRNGLPLAFWGPGLVVGPLMLLLGGNAIWRSLRAGR